MVVGLVTWADMLNPGGRKLPLQVSVCGTPAIVHTNSPEAIDQLIPGPLGSGSVNASPVADAPAPLPFVAVSVNPIVPPAATVGASAVLVSVSAGHTTVVVASAMAVDAFVAVAVAVFEYVPQLVLVVALVTWTDALAPGGRLSAVQVKVLGCPPIEQLGGPEAMDQAIPEPLGNASLIVTPVTVPDPAAPGFDAVIVKPI